MIRVGAAGIAALAWALIYGGLIVAGLGYAVQDGGEEWGWGVLAAGFVTAAFGVALVVVRSAMPELEPEPESEREPAAGDAALRSSAHEGRQA